MLYDSKTLLASVCIVYYCALYLNLECYMILAFGDLNCLCMILCAYRSIDLLTYGLNSIVAM